MCIISSKLYNSYLETYYDEYNKLSDAKKRKFGDNYDPEILFFKGCDCSVLLETKEESTDKEEYVDLSNMPPLEGDEDEVKEGKGLKILTANKLIRLPILLAQITGEQFIQIKK